MEILYLRTYEAKGLLAAIVGFGGDNTEAAVASAAISSLEFLQNLSNEMVSDSKDH